MPRKKLDLNTYLATHPKLTHFFICHSSMSGNELFQSLKKVQSHLPSQFKWVRRTFPTETSLLTAMNSISLIIANNCDLENYDMDAMRTKYHIPCKCRICRDSSITLKSLFQKIPSSSTNPLERKHDDLCFSIRFVDKFLHSVKLSKQSQVFSPQPHPEREPKQCIDHHTRMNASAHARNTFAAVVTALSKAERQAAAVSRARSVIDVIGNPSLSYYHLSFKPGFKTLPGARQPFIKSPVYNVLRTATDPIRTPPFVLQRPHAFGPLPLQPWELPPTPQEVRAASDDVIRKMAAAAVNSPMGISSTADISQRMQDAGCRELLVALAVVTRCDKVPLSSGLFPPDLRTPGPAHIGRLEYWLASKIKLWGLPVVYQALGLSEALGPIRAQLVDFLQLLQVSTVCDHLISTTAQPEL
eukprot:gnl/Dysnectes_brevis/6560_a10270_259.p1 GENE.gnl/Dysnectes_brevis/6560_a10270_259~~gnl/Dysnectes_brevis/6560_a10270_259.p1  ORF type:complete len:414 (+),score=73.66 gnl/Dysnectes_brevis/6560_a10270_259:101-1342(+)